MNLMKRYFTRFRIRKRWTTYCNDYGGLDTPYSVRRAIHLHRSLDYIKVSKLDLLTAQQIDVQVSFDNLLLMVNSLRDIASEYSKTDYITINDKPVPDWKRLDLFYYPLTHEHLQVDVELDKGLAVIGDLLFKIYKVAPDRSGYVNRKLQQYLFTYINVCESIGTYIYGKET